MGRVNVYVDGFNLYHGAKQLMDNESSTAPWKWIDLQALSRRIVPHDTIHLVRYFTARVGSSENDPGLGQRQQVYLRALESLPGLSIHYGQFMAQKKRMPLVDTPGHLRRKILQLLGLNLMVHPDGKVSVRVWRIEEKGSDVNLGVYLLADAFRSQFDKAIVISNDTDLCEPVRMVVEELGCEVIVVNPRGHKQPAVALKKVATETRRLRASAPTNSQLPAVLHDEHGTITKPESW